MTWDFGEDRVLPLQKHWCSSSLLVMPGARLHDLPLHPATRMQWMKSLIRNVEWEEAILGRGFAYSIPFTLATKGTHSWPAFFPRLFSESRWLFVILACKTKDREITERIVSSRVVKITHSSQEGYWGRGPRLTDIVRWSVVAGWELLSWCLPMALYETLSYVGSAGFAGKVNVVSFRLCSWMRFSRISTLE
jgi:hypothetical protein